LVTLFLAWLIDQLVFNHVSFFDYFLSDMARRYSELEEKHLQHQADSTRWYSKLKEKYSQGQIDLARVSASLDDAHFLNSSLNAQLDSERAAHEVNLLNWLHCTYCLLDA
jgi:cell shape-determining protein MreC